MKFVKAALLMVSALVASASAGFYADIATGLSYSTFEVVDKPYYVSNTDAEKVYSDSADGTFKVKGDKQRFTGVGPVLGAKVGYGWENAALFADLGFSWGYGSHEGDDYFVAKDCEEKDVSECLRHEKYSLDPSNSYRLFVGAGFSVSPWGGTGTMASMGGFHFGASFGFSMVNTTTENSEYKEHRAPLSDVGLGLQVEIGQKWLIAGRWDTGFSVVGSWDFPGRKSEGIVPEDYYTIGVQIHVSRH